MKKVVSGYLFIALQFIAYSAIAEVLPLRFAGEDLRTKKASEVVLEQKKAMVVVFLSTKCPCSKSHLVELKALMQKFTNFEFVGIHSNTDEPKEAAVKYFSEKDLPFPVLEDSKTKYADTFRAYKTPHAFIVNAKGEILYRGGVSDSKDFARSKRHYLREALEDISKDEKVRTPEGRTLGCVIPRESQSVW